MAMFPKIQSPCPYKSRLGEVMDGDFCRMCRRNVVDLTHMADAERVAFLAACADEVCVSYRLPLKPALAAAALAASVAALPAAAQDMQSAQDVAAATNPAVEDNLDFGAEIIVGGIKDPKAVEFFDAKDDAALPELPVTYDRKPAVPAAATRPAS